MSTRDLKSYKIHQKNYFDHENFYKAIFNQLPCYISVQDRQLKIITSNKKFKVDFGNKINTYCYETYKNRNTPCIECPVLLTFNDAKSHSTEEVVTTIQGNQYNVITWTAPIYNIKGDIAYVVEISTDITLIRQLQDNLTSLGLMIGSISHGIRGMLTALDGGIYKLQTGIKKNNNERIISAFTQIKQTTYRIRKTILEILYYAKSRELEYENINIESMLNNINKDFKNILEKYNINFTIKNSSFFKCFEADHNWLYIAISNFIENAIDACITDKYKVKHFINIDINNINSNHIIIMISDNGTGMKSDVKNKLFTLFFSSKGSKGTGLGLYTANQIISQHNGHITIKTNYKKGTTIKIEIPVKRNINISSV